MWCSLAFCVVKIFFLNKMFVMRFFDGLAEQETEESMKSFRKLYGILCPSRSSEIGHHAAAPKCSNFTRMIIGKVITRFSF